ncbi:MULTISPECIES: cell division protein FtsA [Carnobacterium]|jgi:cell division protein FtsA|uniref:Cell division protein FtsA n=2 Tax=Carnobacterium maltaromaticum TaxID=2751 RepID=K8E340_CARML|nr:MULTISPECIES: cell division protein FtsA [Carnobacterium]AOA01621.1 cell division protein FtsA [Carnobacterium maltaromaticum]KRN60770.1 cell division protein FtsA [Carnobacterium maltaromaticum DSM 20342]MBC9787106.1 cell division protein FtsA [Carnobacterium maltaromaticum]MBQ6485034.1 cell division protein FtsA [Carnobacterium sp.]MCC4311737.1 cell division protein FtsA [Carnobacterium maltaromaticum]
MGNTGIYVSLDIGTTSIKVVVAEFVNGQMNIIGVGNEKSEGLSRGIIVDIDQTVDSIKKAIKQAEEKANIDIRNVIVGIPANNVKIEPCHGMIAVSGDNREITEIDVENVMAAAMVKSVPPEREIIAVIPEEFVVDGFSEIRDPRGMIGVRLEMHATMITGPKTILHNTKRCVEKAGLQIEEVVLQPLAISSAAMTKEEAKFGTILIDLGGGQSTAAVMHDNQLKFTFVDPEGGEYVSKDISVILNTSFDSAERIKREYGFALPEETSPDEYFPVDVIGKNEPVRIDEQYLSEIIEARQLQIFDKIKAELDAVGARELPGGIVITGGAAALPGLIELAKDVFEINVNLYVPDQMGMRFPTFSTGIGLIEYVANLDEIHAIAKGRGKGSTYTSAQPQKQTSHVEYETEEVVKEKPVKKPKNEEDKFTNKAKNFFTNFFD